MFYELVELRFEESTFFISHMIEEMVGSLSNMLLRDHHYSNIAQRF